MKSPLTIYFTSSKAASLCQFLKRCFRDVLCIYKQIYVFILFKKNLECKYESKNDI